MKKLNQKIIKGEGTMDNRLTLGMLRKKYNLSQLEVAEKLEIAPATWSKWERAKSFPDVVGIKKIEKLFKIKFADIDFLDEKQINFILIF